MLDQLIIGKKASFDDFGASVATRAIAAPAKKTIKETVPFSNITYDFSAINGELYWNERALQYVFEIMADDPASLEYKKAQFIKWVMNVINERIYDPFDPDFHFVGTFDSIDIADDESIEKTTITVTFTAYPYKIANKATNNICPIPASGEKTFIIKNDSGHRITPKIETNQAIIIEIDGKSFSASAGTFEDDVLKLHPGENEMSIANQTANNCMVIVSFFEEVF